MSSETSPKPTPVAAPEQAAAAAVEAPNAVVAPTTSPAPSPTPTPTPAPAPAPAPVTSLPEAASTHHKAEAEAEDDEEGHGGKLITVIGIFKAAKGVLLLLAAVGTFKLLGKDLDDVVDRIQQIFHLDPDGRLVQWCYLKTDDITDGTLKTIAGVGTVYGTLLATEGYGLLRRRKWAEVLVIIATMIPVPVELYELFEKFKPIKLGLLALNLGIVYYLYRRRQEFLTRRQRKALKAAQAAEAARAKEKEKESLPPKLAV